MLVRNEILAVSFFLLAPFLLSAQSDSASEVNKLLELSLEQLMNIKVVTVSGYMQTTL